MAKRSMFVGLDVHKESIDISLAEEGREGEGRHYGVIAGDLEALAKVVRAVRAPTRRLRFVYEAGPCGFGIHRYLTTQGEDCVVVKTPASLYQPSGRELPRQLAPLAYPGHFERRLVSRNSGIRWNKRWVCVPHTLAGEYVASKKWATACGTYTSDR